MSDDVLVRELYKLAERKLAHWKVPVRDKEDLVQELVIDAWENIDSTRELRSCLGWARQRFDWRIKDYLRKQGPEWERIRLTTHGSVTHGADGTSRGRTTHWRYPYEDGDDDGWSDYIHKDEHPIEGSSVEDAVLSAERADILACTIAALPERVRVWAEHVLSGMTPAAAAAAMCVPVGERGHFNEAMKRKLRVAFRRAGLEELV